VLCQPITAFPDERRLRDRRNRIADKEHDRGLRQEKADGIDKLDIDGMREKRVHQFPEQQT